MWVIDCGEWIVIGEFAVALATTSTEALLGAFPFARRMFISLAIDGSIPPRVANGHLIMNPASVDDTALGRSAEATLHVAQPRRTERDERGRATYIELFRAASLIHLNKSWHSRSEGPSNGYYAGGGGGRPFGLIARDGAFSTSRYCEMTARRSTRDLSSDTRRGAKQFRAKD